MKYVIALALLLYGCGHYNGEHVWYRSIGGISNNLKHLNWGTAYAYLSRRTPNVYSDGIGQPSGGGRPSPREISNRLFVQEGDAPDEHGISDWAWQWGQFLDHDISLSEPVANDGEPFLIAIPTGDPIFDPQGKGGQWMPFVRSYHSVTGDSPQNPREQLNQVTSFIDASQVYGSDTTRDKTIRVGGADSLDPAPFLVSSNDTNQDGEYLLPRNVFHVANCSYGVQAKENLFLSGDVRTNEVPGLITIHTIFMREHNRVAKEYVTRFPQASNDTAFQYARKWLGGEMQVITYTEFLPALLGDLAPGLGGQYNPELDPGLSNEFTTVLFRFGHSMIPSTLARVDKSRRREASIPLHDAFFEPKWVSKSSDLDLIVRGLASQVSQRIDLKVVEPLRSYLSIPCARPTDCLA
ncbi:MAG: peroxidase family protein [Deltaproteobacteria bacterium]|nr:peroxidase family protein [Deltaproteobacteria bacterium]